jgi:hypothetical protein
LELLFVKVFVVLEKAAAWIHDERKSITFSVFLQPVILDELDLSEGLEMSPQLFREDFGAKAEHF